MRAQKAFLKGKITPEKAMRIEGLRTAQFRRVQKEFNETREGRESLSEIELLGERFSKLGRMRLNAGSLTPALKLEVVKIGQALKKAQLDYLEGLLRFVRRKKVFPSVIETFEATIEIHRRELSKQDLNKLLDDLEGW